MASTLRVNSKDYADLMQGVCVEMMGEGAYGFRDGIYRIRNHEYPKQTGLFRCTRNDWSGDRKTVTVLPGQVVRLWFR